MELVLATHHFAGFGGSESYLFTVAGQLQRQGHEVTIHAFEHGRIGELAREQGLRVAADESELPDHADALLVQDAAVSYALAALYPAAPQVYVCHSELFDLSTPPQLPGVTSALVTLHDRVGRWAQSLANGQEIARLRQPLDLDRFAPRGVIRERPQRVVAMGNYLRGERRKVVEAVCAQLGLELDVVGSLTVPSERPELALNEADIVIGKARVVYEAMACGRAAYVLDHNGGDGWVTPARYSQMEADNMGGRATDDVVDAERLRRDLAAYSPEMGLANRDLAIANHSVVDHAAALVGLLRRAAPRTRPVEEARELARMARVQWWGESRVAGLGLEIEQLRERMDELERAIAVERAAILEETVDLQRWAQDVESRLGHAKELEAELEALRRTRRFRIVAALARPIDRLRHS